MDKKSTEHEKALSKGKGVLRLRRRPGYPEHSAVLGRELNCTPMITYILGTRGGIDERWCCSTTWAENGPRELRRMKG